LTAGVDTVNTPVGFCFRARETLTPGGRQNPLLHSDAVRIKSRLREDFSELIL
jgi:hypothetical protein